MNSGWLYKRVADALAPYGLSPEEYVRELRDEGVNWSQIQNCLRADIGPFNIPNPYTMKKWVA